MSQFKSFQSEITILMILFKEEYKMVSSCLDNIKNFKVIIIDNANDEDLKKKNFIRIQNL